MAALTAESCFIGLGGGVVGSWSSINALYGLTKEGLFASSTTSVESFLLPDSASLEAPTICEFFYSTSTISRI